MRFCGRLQANKPYRTSYKTGEVGKPRLPILKKINEVSNLVSVRGERRGTGTSSYSFRGLRRIWIYRVLIDPQLSVSRPVGSTANPSSIAAATSSAVSAAS